MATTWISGLRRCFITDSKGRPIAAIGSKNGHLYGVDRETRKRVYDTPIARIENEGVQPTAAGLHVCPGLLGGVEWNGPAYDAKNKAVVVGVVDWCSTITPKPQKDYIPGQFMMGGEFKMDEESFGWVRAIDPDNGTLRWSYKADGPVVAGVTPTAGGVVFTGDMAGNFLVLDSAQRQAAEEGRNRRLRSPAASSATRSAVRSTWRRPRANVSRLTFGVSGSPTLILYKLGGAGSPALAAAGAPAAGSEVSGAAIYGKVCSACHGANAEGGVGPSLKGVSARLGLAKTIEWIKNPSAKMPRFYPGLLAEADVTAVAAHIQKY